MFIRILRKQRLQQGAVALCMGVACVALMRWPQGAASGVSRGLSVCAQVIIPSLFPFLVLSGFFIRAGYAAKMGRKLNGVMRCLFGLPGCCGAAVLIGAIGGYPAGANAVHELLERGEIEEAQAKKALRFCVNGGPAFVIGTVGAGMLGSVYKGILLYIAHLIASFLIGLCQRGKVAAEENKKVPPSRAEGLSKAFTQAVCGSFEALLNMCGFVMLFSAFLELSDISGLSAGVSDVMRKAFTVIGGTSVDFSGIYTAFWEVSCGCVALSAGKSGGLQPLLLGAALGWGGVSVYCQNAGMFADRKLLDGGYLLARAWHALLGGLLSLLLFQLLPASTVTSGEAVATSALVQAASVTPIASVAMLLMCGVFLFSLSNSAAIS